MVRWLPLSFNFVNNWCLLGPGSCWLWSSDQVPVHCLSESSLAWDFQRTALARLVSWHCQAIDLTSALEFQMLDPWSQIDPWCAAFSRQLACDRCRHATVSMLCWPFCVDNSSLSIFVGWKSKAQCKRQAHHRYRRRLSNCFCDSLIIDLTHLHQNRNSRFRRHHLIDWSNYCAWIVIFASPW